MALIIVSSGASSSGLTINSGDTLDVRTGGSVSNITIKSGASMNVSSGASLNNITVQAGGKVNAMRLTSGTTLTNAVQISNAEVDYGDNAHLLSGQTVSTCNISGSMFISHGTAWDLTVQNAAMLGVIDGNAYDVNVLAGADMAIGGTATRINVHSDAILEVLGSAVSTTLLGTMYISEGGIGLS